MNKRKTLVLLLPAMLSFTLISAQLKKGSLWLGGHISYGSQLNRVKGESEPQIDDKDISFEPFFGKSITENSIAGIALYYKNRHDRNTTPLGRRIDEFGYAAGIFFRKYKPLGKGFYIYLNGELNFGYTRVNNARAQDVSDFSLSRLNAFHIFGYPGISYQLTRSIHLEMRTEDILRVSYTDEKKHTEFPVNNIRDEHTTRVGVSTGINRVFNYLGIGFRILINNKESTEAKN
jgi:hypothetical protein